MGEVESGESLAEPAKVLRLAEPDDGTTHGVSVAKDINAFDTFANAGMGAGEVVNDTVLPCRPVC